VTQLDSTALTRAGLGDVAGAKDWFFLSRSNALTMSLSSATSDEMAGVEEFEFTLATTALARDCQTFDLLSMIFKREELVYEFGYKIVPRQWCLGSCEEDGWKSWGLVGEVEKQEGRGDKGLQVGRENRLSVQ
nr:hypothetical protein [Tanacetum cinerariifolium]